MEYTVYAAETERELEKTQKKLYYKDKLYALFCTYTVFFEHFYTSP